RPTRRRSSRAIPTRGRPPSNRSRAWPPATASVSRNSPARAEHGGGLSSHVSPKPDDTMNTNDTIRGILFGAVGGAVGTFCMSYGWKGAEKLHGHDPRMLTREGRHGMDDISAVGQQAESDEASTEAVGRTLHEAATGEEPTQRRKASLS